jgi:dTDP-4-amino-4,6-dideoxygalactose transaminase
VSAPDQPYIPIARPLVSQAEKDAVLAVLESGQLAQGPRTALFEEDFAKYTGVTHAIGLNSGTAALIVALQAHGIGPGDEVITTPFSFIATATSIIACGATPVFVDLDPFDLNLDPGLVEDAVTDDTKAVLVVHLYGGPARMTEITEICDEYDLALIEDAAQAHGAVHDDRRVGSFGTGCFSFYPTKNMTTGEGGMITTDDPVIAERCRAIRNHGQRSRYVHELYGLNWRMTEICAALGQVQLEQLDGWNEQRLKNAERLAMGIDRVQPPAMRPGDLHVFHQYTVRVPNDRDGVVDRLHATGIGAAVHYPVPIHHQPIMVEHGFGDYELPIAEAAAESVLSLPVHPSLTDDEIERIIAATNAAIADG